MIFFIHLLIIFAGIYWLRPSRKLRGYYWSGIGFKVLCGIILGIIYWKLGHGDTLEFHHQASLLHQLPFHEYLTSLITPENPVYKGEGRNEFFIKILSVLYWITDGSYWISGIYLSLISFAGTWYLILQIKAIDKKLIIPAAIGFLWLPSPVLWTSGVMKDSLVSWAIAFLMGVAIKYYQNLKIKPIEIILTTLALMVLFYLKFYVAATVGLCFSLLAWIKLLDHIAMHRKSRIIFTLIFIAIMSFAVTQLNMNLHFENLPTAIINNNQAIIDKSASNNTIQFSYLTDSWSSLILHLPLGLLAGLTRPWLWECNAATFIPALEHLIITVLLIYNLFTIQHHKNNLAILGLVYCVILATFLPLVAPNFGTLIRYEAAYLPLLTFILLISPFKQILSQSKRL